MIIMQFLFFLLLYLLRSLPIQGGDCLRPVTAEKVCCANFEDVDGTCKECRIGTSSKKDESCKECENGFYGKNCLEECRCQNNERCDFIQGCISFTRTTKQLSTQRKGTANILKATVTYTDRSPTNKPSDEKTGKEDDDKIVLYAGAVGLLVIAILIGMLLNEVKNKYCSRQIISEQKDDDRHELAEASLEMYSYEYIDEQNITDQNPFSVPPSLPVPRTGVQHQSDETLENNDSIDIKSVFERRIKCILILINQYK